jgi:hypothetical protein
MQKGREKQPIKEIEPIAASDGKPPTAKGFGIEPVENDNATVEEPTTDFWAGILRLLENEPALHAVVGDRTQVSAEMRDDILFVRAKDLFSSNTLNKDGNKKLLKDAAREALGREVAVRVEMDASDEGDDQMSFEELSKFPIVSIKD